MSQGWCVLSAVSWTQAAWLQSLLSEPPHSAAPKVLRTAQGPCSSPGVTLTMDPAFYLKKVLFLLLIFRTDLQFKCCLLSKSQTSGRSFFGLQSWGVLGMMRLKGIILLVLLLLFFHLDPSGRRGFLVLLFGVNTVYFTWMWWELRWKNSWMWWESRWKNALPGTLVDHGLAFPTSCVLSPSVVSDSLRPHGQ